MNERHTFISPIKPTRQDPTELDVLAAVDPSDHAGTPTYVIRNRLWRRDFRLKTAEVRRVLSQLEQQGRVHRTSRSCANQVHWRTGPRFRSTPSSTTAEQGA